MDASLVLNITEEQEHCRTSSLSNSSMNMRGKIIFYEDRNFQGRSYECMNDCAEMTSYLSRCQSCRVESGCVVIYDRPNFMGNQYFLRRGENAENMSMMGMRDNIRSCRIIPAQRGRFRIRIYERENLSGQMNELMDDCDNIMERFSMPESMSCNVMEGHWLLFEQPHFRGKMVYLKPGEYRSLREMGATLSRVQSLRRILDN
ncbi:gamma-crystallin M3-like [Synchiropus splendidus]|uniref:gamma-crystallin M3-like n=1 Tax=Synchiropus splendidus TaxID=270530 RepID=UPI00237DADC1|nr:gamma-crystallin M3-like [Synchiropus splendidus]